MRYSLCFLLVTFALIADDRKLNTLTEAEEKAGWKLLFDGKSADQWRNYMKESISEGWKVDDGTLHRAGKGAGDIITKDQYDAFELVLEYKIGKAATAD